MKRTLLFSLSFSFVFAVSPLLAETWHQVSWVDDGDTIVLQDGRQVRYIGINAPEIGHEGQLAEPHGYEAKSFNYTLVYQKKVHLVFDHEHHDQYGRWLAYVFLADGSFVNQIMLNQGFAFLLYHQPNITYDLPFLNSQRAAMSAGRGIWQNWYEKKASYIGNKQSRRFHLATCPLAQQMKEGNKVFFSKKWDAFWAGYAPAKKCIKQYWSAK